MIKITIKVILLFLLVSSQLYCQDKGFQSFLLNSSIANSPGYSSEVTIGGNGNAVLFEVMIDGKPYYFLFDTGAMISMISKEAAGDTKYLEKISITDNLGHDQKRSTVKKNLQIGNVDFKDIGFSIMDFDLVNKHGCMEIDGIIGANAIRLCNWQIDPVGHLLKLSDQPFDNETGEHPIELKYYSELLPLVEVTLNNSSFLVLLDTGDDGELSLNRESFKKANILNSKSLSGEGTYKATFNSLIKDKIERVPLQGVLVGRQSMPNVSATITGDKSAIGYGLLKNFITTLNMEENRLYLKPLAEDRTVSNGEYDINLCLNEKDELTVCFIWDGTPLKSAGIKLGDKVVEFNNKRLDKLSDESYCAIREAIRSSQSIIVKIRQGKEEKEYTLLRSQI